MKRFRCLPLFVVALLGLTGLPAHAQQELISNGNFEKGYADDLKEAGWQMPLEGGSLEAENGNHFLRLTSTQPGRQVSLYYSKVLPKAVQAVELSFLARVSNLEVGKQAENEACIDVGFSAGPGRELPRHGPQSPAWRDNTGGWVSRTLMFEVPKDASYLEILPSLIHVDRGTIDIDNLQLRSIALTQMDEPAPPSLISNGNFETAANGWPTDWPRLDHGTSYETEGENHFLRLSATKPDEQLMLYRAIRIPADVKALELSFRMRVTDLKVGAQPWYDARIMMNFKDIQGGKTLDPNPSPPYTRADTQGWVTRTQKFLVPAGASLLEFMPTLFQVKSGTFDLDDVTLTAIDDAPLRIDAAAAEKQRQYLDLAPEAPNPAKWPEELHTQGNQVFNKDGQPVWLQGVNVPSLEWTPLGENVLRSVEVATDEWKANIIRLPVSGDKWVGKGSADGGAAYRKRVDDCVIMAANRGAVTLLDLHNFRAPRQSDLDFWKYAATHFKNNSNVLFDLFNEPHDVSWDVWKNGGFVADNDAPADEDAFLSPEEKELNAKGFHSVGMQKLVDTVRDTGAKNIIVAGGLDWAYDLSGIDKGFALDDKGGNGIMYATHIYPWKTGWENAVLPVVAKYPVIVGEMGANTKKMDFIPAENQEDAATWVPKILGFVQKYKLNWTGWSFHPGASPVLIQGWDFKPTPEWGALAKRELAGEPFPYLGTR